jgi:predicted negative regulator of RcsB-dependent stress response
VAKYKKKRARELKQDRFRDTTMSLMDRLGDRLEGKGKTILYGLVGVVVLGALLLAFNSWRRRKADEAKQALGRAIEISQYQVTATPIAGSTEPTFPNETERARRAVEEFRAVEAKYSGSTREMARYFAANNLLLLDRPKAIGELQSLTQSSDTTVATLAKFALAQTKEADEKYDEAAALYADLAKSNSLVVTPETANLRLASVYEKQGKKKEAADVLFNIVEPARKAKDKDGKPLPPSAAVGEASKKLEKLDPERYAQLTPEATPPGAEG